MRVVANRIFRVVLFNLKIGNEVFDSVIKIVHTLSVQIVYTMSSPGLFEVTLDEFAKG